MSKQFDLIVIGAGPGGYIAAIRAAQLGMNVACIDEWSSADGKPAPGGTCTNVGCIPSKALLQSSEHYEHAEKHFADHGIGVSGLKMDVAKMVARKDAVVKQNNDGILYLFKKNKVAYFNGTGSFAGKDGDQWKLAVAGAKPAELVAKPAPGLSAAGAAFDEELILQRRRAAHRRQLKKLALIGSGVIGLEMGSVWLRLGADVTVLQPCPRSWARGGRSNRQGSPQGLRQAGPEDRTGGEGDRRAVGQEGCQRELHRCQGRSPETGRGQAHRLHRPRCPTPLA